MPPLLYKHLHFFALFYTVRRVNKAYQQYYILIAFYSARSRTMLAVEPMSSETQDCQNIGCLQRMSALMSGDCTQKAGCFKTSIANFCLRVWYRERSVFTVMDLHGSDTPTSCIWTSAALNMIRRDSVNLLPIKLAWYHIYLVASVYAVVYCIAVDCFAGVADID